MFGVLTVRSPGLLYKVQRRPNQAPALSLVATPISIPLLAARHPGRNRPGGFSLTSSDYNGDGYDDLVIGVPYEDGGATNAGGVNIVYGSATGLSPAGDQFWNQDSADVEDAAGADDNFGFSLTSSDYNGDGYDDLVIGVPFEDITTAVVISDAGAANVIHGSSSGLSPTLMLDQLWDQSMIIPPAEAVDSFGWSLTSGDFNRDFYADLAMGVPGEDVGPGPVADAGAVNAINGKSGGLTSTDGLTSTGGQQWHQDIASVRDIAEASDKFGRLR